ncbi:hypothetical protein [uncultured Ruminococcus sp.]|uniref:hypothetical protein n=1 Tax=uncultured Ruminococcus sp. TaxID=165186 RepID=UPI0025F28030|nr:hypothetical protein [uncultured Ruminococcus sp.]
MNYDILKVSNYRMLIKKYPYGAVKKRIIDNKVITIPDGSVQPKYGSNLAAIKNIIAYGCKIGILKATDEANEYIVVEYNNETLFKFFKYRPPVGLSGRKRRGGAIKIIKPAK